MIDNPLFLWLLLGFIVIALAGYWVHHLSYRALYSKLSGRNLVGPEYKPDWISRVSSSACMGYIKKFKREIGLDKLTPEEASLVRRVIYSYNLGVPAVFLFTCVLFLLLYRGEF